MASSITIHLLLLLSTYLLLSFTHPSFAQRSFRPKALVLPVTKDASTLQYLTHINQRTPLVQVNLVVDLGGQFLWVDCQDGYVSSTYTPARCGSAQCFLARASSCRSCNAAQGPGCNNNTCVVTPDNTVTHTATSGEVASDVVSIQSTDGSNPGRAANVSRFLFACGSTSLLEGLASGTKGMAGLGRTRIALPSQFSSPFSFRRKFALCLTSSTTATGVIFFGDGPYNLLPNVDASESLAYTPLFVNPVSTASASSQGEASTEYFIRVTALNVSDTVVAVNETLLTIDLSNGYGGTKLSTVDPYTVLESSIFNALTEAFIAKAAAMNIPRVSAVSPFDVCFSSANVASTSVGPAVPYIYLTLRGGAVWTITGSNSMVQVNDDVLCLAFVNGGSNPRTSIVIGGFQLENNLIQIDLAYWYSRLGFSSTLLGRQTTCANFNFTASA